MPPQRASRRCRSDRPAALVSPAPSPGVPLSDWSAYFRQVARERADRPSYARNAEAYRRSLEAPDATPGFVSQRIAVLRNATVEPWLPEFFAALLQRGVKATFRVGDYSVYEQHATEVGHRGKPEPDHCFLYFDPVELAGDARHEPPDDVAETLLARVEGIVGGLRRRSRARVIVANLPPGPVEAHALHGDQDPRSWHQRRRALNLALVRRLSAMPGVAILDLDRVVGEHGRSQAYDLRMAFLARSPFSAGFLPRLADAFADIVAAAALPPKKCVVVDCDNTLWGGVLGEDGPDGVAIGAEYPGSVYREFQQFLKGLARRGFLLAMNSKNNEADVLAFLARSPDMALRADDFSARRINWNDKAANIEEIAAELDIGLDSVIFVDDSPVECERVRTAFPEVQVEQFPSDPLAIPAFMTSLPGTARLHVTDDDLKRAASLRANAQREGLRRAAPDLDAFVRSLGIELAISRQDRSAVRRVSQLAQRTNQFNLTTKRYSVSDVERLMDAGVVYTMRMKDRFSDYGVVGVAVATPRRAGVPAGDGGARADGGGSKPGRRPVAGDEWEIDSFLLSCRAFGRKIESELLHAVLEDARRNGVRLVRARRVSTSKNGMTRSFYPDHGFSEVRGDGEERYAIVPAESVRRGSDGPSQALCRVTLCGFAARTPQRSPEPRPARTP